VIEDTLEAGLVLHGTRSQIAAPGRAPASPKPTPTKKAGSSFLVNANIPEYKASAHFNHEPRRPRKAFAATASR